MPIIGKILEEKQTYLNTTLLNYVLTGKQEHLSVNMMKVAFYKLLVSNAMDGKNKSIIH